VAGARIWRVRVNCVANTRGAENLHTGHNTGRKIVLESFKYPTKYKKIRSKYYILKSTSIKKRYESFYFLRSLYNVFFLGRYLYYNGILRDTMIVSYV